MMTDQPPPTIIDTWGVEVTPPDPCATCGAVIFNYKGSCIHPECDLNRKSEKGTPHD